jgi:hypothetical protein
MQLIQLVSTLYLSANGYGRILTERDFIAAIFKLLLLLLYGVIVGEITYRRHSLTYAVHTFQKVRRK